MDGNNVMGQRVGWHRDKAAAQRLLLRDLSEFSDRESQAVTAVFDGRPLPGINDGDTVAGIVVFFARPGSDADQRILELAGGAERPGEITVVTSDRQLTDRLRSSGVRTTRSGQFRRRLETSLRSIERQDGEEQKTVR